MSTMNALRFHPPGGPEKLKYEQVPIPSLQPTQLLIRVHAASVIAPELTWPIYQDQNTGEYPPHIPCHDFSGTVVRVGSDVEKHGTGIKVGSEVFAFTTGMTETWVRAFEGAAAEYSVADVKTVVLKPKNMTLTEAATVPLSALTAWQALHDQLHLHKGQRLLITGAAGATALWAVQLAKKMGAYVIGTASSEWSFQTLKSLGIDEVIDYKKQSVVDAVSDVDLVLDAVGGKAMDDAVKTMKKDGELLSIVEFEADKRVANGVKAKFFIVEMNTEQLGEIKGMIEEGELKTFIDTVYPLEKGAEAFRYGAKGGAHGKILLSVAS